ncbi:DNA cross-link repair 1A protein [Acipenser ruthenus]|uniref:DNA cross-link repair 1A protein n=1 Tax=Acipenser ruthenus TaxID=7906 RepID=A0A444TZY9_ACIRT|nr:DNA cross-link repair 1A protein [Acipenser ruthenus]
MSDKVSEDDIWEYTSIRKKPKIVEHNTKKLKEITKLDGNKTTRQSIGKKNRKKNLDKASSLEEETTPDVYFLHQHPSTPIKQHRRVQSNGEKQTATNGQTVHEGHCPGCQMPFSVLVVQTPRWHVAECLDTPGSGDGTECPDGLHCSSTIPNHYKRYTHLLLAQSRATGDQDCCQETLASASTCHSQNIDPSPTGASPTSQQENTAGSKPNALLLLRSPASAEIKKRSRTTPSPRAATGKISSSPKNLDTKQSLVGSQRNLLLQKGKDHVKASGLSMERGPRNVPEDFSSLPLSAAVPSDEEISYSPLCSDSEEVKPKHELFHTNINECKEGVVNNYNGLDFASSQSLTKSPNLWDEDLSDTDLFSDYFNESPLNGIDSNKRMNSTAVDHSTQTVQTCGPWLAQPECHYNYEIINTECQLHKLISPGNEILKEDLVVSDGTSYCFTQERSSTLVDSLHAKSEPVVSFHSPQSVVLEHLRNRLTHTGGRNGSHSDVLHSLNIKQERPLTESVTPSQNLNPHSRKMAPKRLLVSRSKPSNAGLRQTDIGVFFGLKPLKEKEIEVKEKQPNKTTQAATSELNSEVHPSKRKPRQRKRKATSSIGDSAEQEAVDGSNNNEALTPKEKGSRPRRRGWCKGGSAKELENGDAPAARRCPFYKNIPGTGFVVDAFQYGAVEGCTAYFLTHFHSDHYGGLKKSFRLPIYCNKITGNLVKSKLGVEEQYVNILPMNTECTVDGVRVTLLDANHCPGAAMLLLHLPNGKTVLHTGDFRADPSMERYPELVGQKVQTLYLDTTYCSPEYTFPTQQEAITFAATTAFETLTSNPRTLVVCGTYSIGKEKVFLAIADVLGCKVCVSRDKYNIMCCLESERIKELITMDWDATQLHVLPMMQVSYKGLQTHLNKFSGKYDQIVAFKPTGWVYSGLSESMANIRPRVRGNITVYDVPYSEHSGYLEMKRFVQWLKPEKIIPTVNVGNPKERRAMESVFREWKSEMKQKTN